LQRTGKGFGVNIKAKIELIEFTDPYCTWCWGSEPILRRIQETYGEQVTLRFVMGGLMDDADHVNDPANGIGGSDWKRQVAAHWLDASSRHGMPVDISEFAEKVAPKSTYPANIAYEAAKLQNPELADRYLRRLREAAATESRSIHLPEVQADIAEELGLDRIRFFADLAGSARQAFADDQRFCHASGAHGFPTFLIRAGGRERLLRGYNRFPAFAAVFDSLAGEPLEKNRLTISEGAVLDFIGKYGSAVAREVVEVFGVSDSEAEAILCQLVSKGQIEAHPAGTGTLYRALQSGEYCDPLTGACM
jgi:predicted DsbA family dithiol-disulfide isomerase